MMMKTGIKLFSAGIAILYMYKFFKKNKNNKPDPSVVQFYERLKEHSFGEDLAKSLSDYLRLIDYGLNPNDAFRIVSEK